MRNRARGRGGGEGSEPGDHERGKQFLSGPGHVDLVVVGGWWGIADA